MKLKCYSFLIAFLTVILFAITEPVSVFAVNENSVPDIDDQSKSLTVYFFIQKTGVDTPIPGAEIGIYKIADLQVEGGSANYTVLDEYASLKKVEDERDVTFDGLSFSDSTKLAKQFAELVKEPEETALTNDKGICKFYNMQQGMYLVCELSVTGEAEQYELFEPYMISVPLAVENNDGENEWLYEVLSEPKTKVIDLTSEESGGNPNVSEVSTVSDTSGIEHSQPSKSSSLSDSSSPAVSSQPQPSASSEVTHQPSQTSDGTTIFTGETTSWIFAILGMWFASVLVVLMTGKKKKGVDENE